MTGFGVTLSLVLVSAAFGQEPGPAVPTSPGVGIAPTSPASITDLSKDRWWISETIAQSRKDQPVFFGVRLANAPQAALVETYKQFLTAGETLAVRLWGCNDLPKEFKGRVQVVLKRGNEQFARREETVRLAPETVKRLAKYNFDTAKLAAGQYALETSLYDNGGELVQQQVTTVTVRVTQKQELSRSSAVAQAAEKAKKEAELKARADLSRRSALAKRDAEKQAAAEAKAQAQAAEKAKKEAELKARADLSRRSALAKVESEKQAAEAEAAKKAELKAKADSEKKAAADAKAQAQAAEKAKKEAELKAKADLSRRSALAKVEAEKKAAEAEAAKKAELKAKADLSRRSALAKRDAEKKAEADARAQAQAAEKAKKEAELKARADLSRRSALAKVEAEKQAAEAEAAKKAAEQKLYEDTKSKYMAQEKAAIAVKAQALVQQEAEYQTKVTQAEAEQQAAEIKAAALALEAKTTPANLDTATTLEKRLKQIAKQDAPKDVKAKRAVEAKAAEEARKQADLSRRSALAKADAAKQIAEDKAKAVSDAKAALAKQQKRIAEQKADLEAQAVKNAERQAKEKIKANEVIAKAKYKAELKAKADLSRRSALAKREAEKQAADELSRRDALAKAEAKAKQAEEAKVARETKVKARIEARTEVIVRQPTDQPATEAQADLSRRSALAKGEAGKPVVVKPKDLKKEKWRVAVGMLYRRIGAQGFKTMGSYSRGYAIGQKSTDDHWVGPAGGLNDAGNRIYDDGYVGSDDYTDLDSGTWNWGYDNGRQVNGNQLEFTGVSRVWRDYSRQTTVTEVENSDNAAYSGGLMVEAERYLAQTRFVDYGLSFGLSRAQAFGASVAGVNTFNDSQRWETYNDRVLDAYDITGLGITPDSVPYNGNRRDQGPVISTSPMTRRDIGSELVSADSYRAYNSISESLDMDLSTLSLGMSIKGTYRRVYVVGSTGPTLNMVEKDAKYEETLYESSGGSPRVLKYWSDSSSENEYLFGYYVQAEVGVRVYRELHLGVFGRYDWLENVSGKVGPSRYEVNPTGGSMGGTVGLNF